MNADEEFLLLQTVALYGPSWAKVGRELNRAGKNQYTVSLIYHLSSIIYHLSSIGS